MTQWSIMRNYNYSTMDFEVPIQKNTEREIFDYIDLDSMKELLLDRWFKKSAEDIENDVQLNWEEIWVVSEEKLENIDKSLEGDDVSLRGSDNVVDEDID